MKNNTVFTRTVLVAATLIIGFGLSACSTSSDEGQIYAGDIEITDPLEESNRTVFAFNNTVDNVVINPVIKGYRAVVPSPARTGLHNFLVNLGAPIDFMNQILQGDVGGAGDTLVRTVVNTFVGIGGLWDVAGVEGIEREPEDFGQTLATWGVGHGPFLVVPFLGPSSLRDYSGYFVDAYADPLRFYYHNINEMHIYYKKAGVEYFDLRESLYDVLNDLEASSIDYYATMRSAYYQNRQAAVNDENTDDAVESDIPDYEDF